MAFTTINDPSEHFQVDLWTSTASSQAVTNDGNSDLQGDMLILIARNLTQNKRVHDTTRGNIPAFLELAGAWSQAQQKVISYDETSGSTFANNYDVEFDSDGFTVGSAYPSGHYSTPQWKANGGSTSSNTDGTITSTVQADTTAGFSIVKYTGTGTAGTIGHGLGAVPKMIWVKHRGPSGGPGGGGVDIGEDWVVWHDALSSSAHSVDISRGDVESDTNDYWDSTYPTSSVFSVKGSSDEVNSTHSNDSAGYMAYCWTDIQGYSKFGSWLGDGVDGDGPFIYTGFRPECIIIRGIDGSDREMSILDGRRVKDHDGTDAQYNPVRERSSLTNSTGNHAYHTAFDTLDICANGFKILGLPSSFTINKTDVNYIWAAWAKHPFVTSTGIPGTAR